MTKEERAGERRVVQAKEDLSEVIEGAAGFILPRIGCGQKCMIDQGKLELKFSYTLLSHQTKMLFLHVPVYSYSL